MSTEDSIKIKGSCLCGKVAYEASPPVRGFQYCHCSRCRKFTGSAHASNLFVKPEQFSWIQGKDSVGRFELAEATHFATCFCKRCGSSLPWENKTRTIVVIPAGSLDEDPGIVPTWSMFWESRASWFRDVKDLPRYAELPPRQ